MGHLRKHSNGHLLKVPTGPLALSCIVNIGRDCPYCPEDPTPEFVDVVFSGIALIDSCCDCIHHGPFRDGTLWDPAPTPIDGAYQLTQITRPPGSCYWRYEEAVTGTWKMWEDDLTCTGGEDESIVVVKMRIYLLITETGKTLYAGYCTAEPTGCAIDVISYWELVDIGGDCFDRSSVNDCTCGEGCAGRNCTAATGGMATITYDL